MTIEERLEKLEKNAMLVGNTQNVIFAKSFVVIGENNKPNAILGTPDGSGMLLLADKMGKPRISLDLSVNGEPLLRMLDENGKKSISLTVSKDGISKIEFYDKKGEIRADLGIIEDGSPVLMFFDSNGSMKISLNAGNSVTSLSLIDENRKSCIGMAIEENGLPELMMESENGDRCKIESKKERNISLTFANKENGGIVMSVNENGPGIGFLDKGNNVIWQAPDA